MRMKIFFKQVEQNSSWSGVKGQSIREEDLYTKSVWVFFLRI